MGIVIETDIGHDPDDFLAICWLISKNIKIDAILIVPGSTDQIAIAQFIVDYFGLHIPVCASNYSDKLTIGGPHIELLKKYKRGRTAIPDGTTNDILGNIEQLNLIGFGPLTNISNYLTYSGRHINEATLQGGFCPYSVYRPTKCLDKFEGINYNPTFNFCGNPKGVHEVYKKSKFVTSVGKNICHTVVYDKNKHESWIPKNDAMWLFYDCMDLYLKKHSEKKLHDPTAAVASLYPEVFTWIGGYHYNQGNKYTVLPTGQLINNSMVAVDLDYENLWYRILE